MKKQEKIGAIGVNTYYTMNNYIPKIINESKQRVVEIFAYSFIVLIGILSTLNIFNTIVSSINLRKKDFAVLKSLGMSQKQINKMLTLEGMFYCLDSIIYGLLISMMILYLMFTKMQNTNLYTFEVPWIQIAISIIVTYIITFIAMWTAKSTIKKQNIIDEIRNENI